MNGLLYFLACVIFVVGAKFVIRPKSPESAYWWGVFMTFLALTAATNIQG